MDRIIACGVVVMAGVLVVASLVSGYLMFLDGSWPEPVVRYETQEFPTDRQVYDPGDSVWIRVQAYKSRNLVGMVQWSLVNQRIQYFVPRELPLPSGVVDQWVELKERIPKSCAAGEHRFEGVVTYAVNPLRSITYKVVTRPFHVSETKETK